MNLQQHTHAALLKTYVHEGNLKEGRTEMELECFSCKICRDLSHTECSVNRFDFEGALLLYYGVMEHPLRMD